jgi:AGCS family alanine or glycine:cation symporter
LDVDGCFFGASTAFVEATLAQIYKEKHLGEFRGGPAFYIERGLGVKWFAVLFAVVSIISAGVLLPEFKRTLLQMEYRMPLK